MLRKVSSALRNLTRDQRGNNLIAYALVLGAVGIAGAGYLAHVSTSLKSNLNGQATKIAKTAGTYVAPPASPTATKPGTPAGTTPTSGSGTTGSGSGSSGKGSSGKGKR